MPPSSHFGAWQRLPQIAPSATNPTVPSHRMTSRRIGNISAKHAQTPIRLMPLGGSITHGVGSFDQNGYRKSLFELLQADGFDVRMVGSRKSGTMSNNDHEGWRGFRIDQIEAKALLSAERLRPQIFTVNAGSNDCLQDYKLGLASKRVEKLLEGLWKVCPDSTVILSSLIVNRDVQVDARIQEFNGDLSMITEKLERTGRKIVFADMHGIDGPIAQDLLGDDTHPDDTGYWKMARIWLRSIQEASNTGYVAFNRNSIGTGC